MVNEKNEPKGLKIYCVYFENKNPIYNGDSDDDPKNILKQIAILGGTQDFYMADSLKSLHMAFINISNAVEINVKLAHNFNN